MGIRKNLAFSLIIAILVSGCGVFSSSPKAPKEIEIDEKFVSEVSLACSEINDIAIDALKDNYSLRDPDAYNKTLSDAEEEYDNIIAKLTAIDPDENVKSDWNTFLDDFTAIRDSFPQLSTVLNQLTNYELNSTAEVDLEEYRKNQQRIESLQNRYDMLVKSNKQRAQAIEDTAETWNVSGCDLD